MLCWSPDSTQVASACANGKLMVSTLVERLELYKLDLFNILLAELLEVIALKKLL